MALDCPICGQKMSATEAFCGGCGFPAALHPEAMAIVDEPEAPIAAKTAAPRASAARRPAQSPARSRDQTAEACNRSARELFGHLEILGQLGGAPQSFLGEMRQAALVQAEGRPAESLELLKAAEVRATREVTALFGRRAQELEGRSRALSQQGVQPEIEPTLERLHASLTGSDRAAAARSVVEADRRLSSLEQDLRGIHGLLEQITTLRAASAAAGHPHEEVDGDLAQIRELLGRPKVDASVLDTAGQIAARALMLLNESLPTILGEDLDKNAAALGTYPQDHEGARAAQRIHSEATRHLRRGRLPEAAARLAELRRAVVELERSPPVVRTPTPVVATSVASEAGGGGEEAVPADETLPRLLSKARSLATRVRALAPESELAFEAAAEIRRATELLRARKLEEADSALTRLMRTLDSESLPEA